MVAIQQRAKWSRAIAPRKTAPTPRPTRRGCWCRCGTPLTAPTGVADASPGLETDRCAGEVPRGGGALEALRCCRRQRTAKGYDRLLDHRLVRLGLAAQGSEPEGYLVRGSRVRPLKTVAAEPRVLHCLCARPARVRKTELSCVFCGRCRSLRPCAFWRADRLAFAQGRAIVSASQLRQPHAQRVEGLLGKRNQAAIARPKLSKRDIGNCRGRAATSSSRCKPSACTLSVDHCGTGSRSKWDTPSDSARAPSTAPGSDRATPCQ